MRFGLFIVVLALCGCPVQVDQVNVQDPRANANVNVGAGGAGGSGAMQVSAAKKPDVAAEQDADAGVAEEQSPGDFDGDGIPDRLDTCPTGKDQDHDGKCDNEDPCPKDSFDDRDHDGICDSDDPCPDGPVDTDGDGVCDAQDKCPKDAHNDSDGDGKCDSDDPCPADAHNDSDGDGTCDSVDKCAGHDDREDVDHDGVPNACDVCPAGSDEDADHNGYADACEQVLWEQGLLASGPVDVSDYYVTPRPALMVVQAQYDLDCFVDGVGWAFLGVPIHQFSGDETQTIDVPRPTTGLAGALVECLEHGVPMTVAGYLSESHDNYTGTSSLGGWLHLLHDVPTVTGKHITHFQVYATAYWQSANQPSGTRVGDFKASIIAYGY